MSDRLVTLYHRLPPVVRMWAASGRGYYLRRQRYGREADQLIAAELQQDYWTPTQWRTWRTERLTRLLHRAATRVPYYREYWERRDPTRKRRDWQELQNWPILDKETVRQDPEAFLADDRPRRSLSIESTSGTTGTPLRLFVTRAASRAWYAAHDAHCRHWHGLSRHDRWAILGGRLVVPVHARKPPFWVWNAGLHQLYLSIQHLTTASIQHYLQALVEYRIQYLYGYTSALCGLAQEVVHQGRALPMRVVVTNAEPLNACQRQVISQAFQCPVQETYGTGEQIVGASECAAGRLHWWPSVGIIEVLRDNVPVPPGTIGEFICTGLLNEAMPLVRYRVGDLGALACDPTPCPCGRTLPVLGGIQGRNEDILYMRDGRKVFRLDPVFKADLPIREAQIIQESLASIRVLVVPAPGFDTAAVKTITARIQDRVGPMTVVIEMVERLQRQPNQKLRGVVCRLSEQERQALAAPPSAVNARQVDRESCFVARPRQEMPG